MSQVGIIPGAAFEKLNELGGAAGVVKVLVPALEGSSLPRILLQDLPIAFGDQIESRIGVVLGCDD